MVQRVAIVGGGVAGLTLAAALDPRQFACTLHEAQPERSHGGAAFGIWRSAERALRSVGVAPPPSFPVGGALHHVSGRRLLPLPPVPIGLTERAALMTALGAALPSSVRVVHEQVTDPASLDADLVVGADGVRSVVRGLVDPAAAARRPTPYVATRGVLRGQPTTTGEGEYWGRGLIFGRQRLNADDTYWFSAFRDDGAVEPLDPARVAADARRRFRGVAPLIERTLEAAGDDLLATRLWVAPALRRYHRDRFVLVGDAAHGATPNLGRGACSAILDAVSLARTLNDGRPVGAWQRRRLPVTQAERITAGAIMKVAASPRL